MMHPPDEDRGEAPLPDTWIHMARTGYNVPGDVPREEMWRAIEAGIRPSTPARRRRWPAWPGLAAAAVAVLILGVGLGRISTVPDAATGPVGAASGPGTASPAAAAPTGAPRVAGAALRTATARHLTDSEALLAFVTADAREGRTDREVGRWGKDLLTQTRLLLDSPVATDPALRSVLEDLEVVLAQVALLASDEADADRIREELSLIARGVVAGGVRNRIRTVLPSVDAGLAAADD